KATLRFVEGAGLPLLSEARELPRDPVVEVKPQDRPGAFTIKAAVVRRIPSERGGTSLALEAPGQAPLPVILGGETRVYNMEGKPAHWNAVLREGMPVSAICVPRAGTHLVLEARQTGPGEPPPPP